jgi:hypothetical protein
MTYLPHSLELLEERKTRPVYDIPAVIERHRPVRQLAGRLIHALRRAPQSTPVPAPTDPARPVTGTVCDCAREAVW